MLGSNIKVAVDTHTHTLVSGHAYNTISEMVAKAASMGLEGIALTEHAPEMPGGAHQFYFQNHGVLPRKMSGIEILFGAELNIMDGKGTVDLPEGLLKELDITIASIHVPCFGKNHGKDCNTQAYLNVMKNDYVDIIGHPDDGRYEVDYETIVEMAKKTGTLIEINNSSMRPGGFRKNAYENDIRILELCKKNDVMVTLGSDAHVDSDIANTSYSSMAIREVDFPEYLIANMSLQRLKRALKRNR